WHAACSVSRSDEGGRTPRLPARPAPAPNYLHSLEKLIMAKLLIVDDEPNVLNALRRMCLNHDAAPAISNPQVMTFTSPLQALAYLQDHPVDLIISDFRMPELSSSSASRGPTTSSRRRSCRSSRTARCWSKTRSSPTRFVASAASSRS